MPDVELNEAQGTARTSSGVHRAHGIASSLFPRCANPACATGWMHLWRNRRLPRFDGRWACSFECMCALVATAMRREWGAAASVVAARAHRVPIGLLLVEQGRISEGELRRALDSWRHAKEDAEDGMRFGQWLVKSGSLTESELTRALSAQWNCPAFSLAHYRPEETASVMPRILVEAFAALPVYAGRGGLVYLAFCGAIDRSLSYAVARATGLRVIAGIAGDSEFRHAQGQYLLTPGPRMQLLEAADPWSLARAIAGLIEREKPLEARLVRVHSDIWLRFWRSPAPEQGYAERTDVEDVLCVLRNLAVQTHS